MRNINVTSTIDLDSFEYWGGAAERIEEIRKFDRENDYERRIDDAHGIWYSVEGELQEQIERMAEEEQGITTTDVNDYLWFDFYDWVGDNFDCSCWSDRDEMEHNSTVFECMFYDFAHDVLGSKYESEQ